MDDSPSSAAVGGDGTVRLASVIPLDDVGLKPLKHVRRGLLRRVFHHDIWDRVLCEGVPISLRELVSLCLSQLELENNERNMFKMLRCHWTLGWHVMDKSSSGVTSHYWGGGVTPKTTSSYLRGDWIEIGGTELCRGEQTSRLARIICGVQIKNIKHIFQDEVHDNVYPNTVCKEEDYVVYLLIRYANAHPDCGRHRGPECRPLCPGPFMKTHCLWKWAERPAYFRRGCFRPRPWQRHRHLFGETDEQQNLRHTNEQRAWYDIIQVGNIKSYSNVQQDWDRRGAFLQSVMWC